MGGGGGRGAGCAEGNPAHPSRERNRTLRQDYKKQENRKGKRARTRWGAGPPDEPVGRDWPGAPQSASSPSPSTPPSSALSSPPSFPESSSSSPASSSLSSPPSFPESSFDSSASSPEPPSV